LFAICLRKTKDILKSYSSRRRKKIKETFVAVFGKKQDFVETLLSNQLTL
jgi:hypothetical protein